MRYKNEQQRLTRDYTPWKDLSEEQKQPYVAAYAAEKEADAAVPRPREPQKILKKLRENADYKRGVAELDVLRPKKPQTAAIRYNNAMRKRRATAACEGETKVSDFQPFSALSDEQKQPYVEAYKRAKETYDLKIQEYISSGQKAQVGEKKQELKQEQMRKVRSDLIRGVSSACPSGVQAWDRGVVGRTGRQ